MPHVFLSYVREDSVIVDRLARNLRSAGVNVWMDRLSIKPGERWDTAIREAVRSGDFFIACFSENSVKKSRSGMNQELVLAVEELMWRPLNRGWFIPVLLTPCSIPEYSLGGTATLKSIQYVSLFGAWQDGVEKILEVVSPLRLRPKERPAKTRLEFQERLRDYLDDYTISKHYAIMGELSFLDRDDISFIVDNLRNPLEGYRPQAWLQKLLIEKLGKIGPDAAEAVPQIIECALNEYTYRQEVIDALVSIGSPTAIPFLRKLLEQYPSSKECWTKYSKTMRHHILLALVKIGDPAGLSLAVEDYLSRDQGDNIWGLPYPHDPIYDFPYRQLYALRDFGFAFASLMNLLNTQLVEGDLIRQIRVATALADFSDGNSKEYESHMLKGLLHGGRPATEALLGLRCFEKIENEGCIAAVIQFSRSPDETARLVAVKVLVQNCITCPAVANAINDRDLLPENSTIQNWSSLVID